MHKQLCRYDSSVLICICQWIFFLTLENRRLRCLSLEKVTCHQALSGCDNEWSMLWSSLRCCLWPSRKITQMSSYNMTIGRRKSRSMWILLKRVSVVAKVTGVTTDHGRQCESRTCIELLVRKVIRTYIPLLTTLAPMPYWNDSFTSSSSSLLEKLNHWPLSWRFSATLLQNWFMAPGFKPTRWITGLVLVYILHRTMQTIHATPQCQTDSHQFTAASHVFFWHDTAYKPIQ